MFFFLNKAIFHLNILVYVKFIELQNRVIDDAFKMIIIKEDAFKSLQIEVVLTYQPLLQWLFKVATVLKKWDLELVLEIETLAISHPFTWLWFRCLATSMMVTICCNHMIAICDFHKQLPTSKVNKQEVTSSGCRTMHFKTMSDLHERTLYVNMAMWHLI